MIGITLDIQPGEVAYFGVGGRVYSVTCAGDCTGQVESTPRALERGETRNLRDCWPSWRETRTVQTRQLALPAPSSATLSRSSPSLPDGVSIRFEEGVWIGIDELANDQIIVWSSDREIVELKVAEYCTEIRRQSRAMDRRDQLRKNRLP
jgi:hypothetical protein